MKTCPQCAEEVQSKAKVCKHCRHRFTAWDELPAQEKASMERGAEIFGYSIGIAVAVTIVVAVLFS